MLKHLNSLLLVFCLFMLSGCATYFERAAQNECFDKDWFAAGFDGAKYGQDSAKTWQNEDRKCAKYNIWSNQQDFQRGYELGLDAFCTEQNGFEFGLRDRSYYPLCSSDEQLEFDLAYRDGQRLYELQSRLDGARYEVSKARNFISYAKERREYLVCEIESGKLDDKTLEKYKKERYHLEEKRLSAKYDLHEYRDRAYEFERRLSDLEPSIHQRYYPNGEPTEPTYSVEHSVVSENQIVSEPAILLYKPATLPKAEKKELKEQINEIVAYMTTQFSRAFRFQVVKDVNLSFIKKNGAERQLALQEKFNAKPTLIFWQPQQELVFQTLESGQTAPLTALDSFISEQEANYKLTLAKPVAPDQSQNQSQGQPIKR